MAWFKGVSSLRAMHRTIEKMKPESIHGVVICLYIEQIATVTPSSRAMHRTIEKLKPESSHGVVIYL